MKENRHELRESRDEQQFINMLRGATYHVDLEIIEVSRGEKQLALRLDLLKPLPAT